MKWKRLYPTFLRPSVKINHSKSWSNRALLRGAQCKEKVEITNLSDSTDTMYLIEALKKIGLKIEIKAQKLTIYNSFPQCEVRNKEANEIYCGDAGTTTRFLTSLLGLGDNIYTLKTNQRMMLRPMDGLFHALEKIGAKTNPQTFTIQGPVKESAVTIDCSKTTQFYSALLLTFSDESLINPLNLNTSKTYTKLTHEVVKKINSDKEITIPVDWSSAAYAISYAALTTDTLFTNINKIDHLQPDSQILTILKRMGGKYSLTSEGLRVFRSELNAVHIDCSDHPDLVMALSFLCSYASGKSVLKNIKTLMYKESDRIKEMMDTLSAFGVQHFYDASRDELSIEGVASKAGYIRRELPEDHRIIFLNSLFMFYNNGGEITNSHSINKSFKDFYNIFQG